MLFINLPNTSCQVWVPVLEQDGTRVWQRRVLWTLPFWEWQSGRHLPNHTHRSLWQGHSSCWSRSLNLPSSSGYCCWTHLSRHNTKIQKSVYYVHVVNRWQMVLCEIPCLYSGSCDTNAVFFHRTQVHLYSSTVINIQMIHLKYSVCHNRIRTL